VFRRPNECIILFLLFFLSINVFARDIEIYVEDEDLRLPLEGATVILRSGTQFVCDKNGIAKVTLPDDSTAIVSITYPGYETFRLQIPATDNVSRINRYTASLHIGNIMHGNDLVVVAARPETNETRSGRNVAISEREMTRTAEIGIIEDVMSSVKLLPGVGYTGMFGAMPSIRGGDPDDLTASLDGFYLERPYHWLGAVSIFDPKMVSSARLSHGVFSARYGHTVSGLLEITSKSPSTTITEFEAGISTSAASLNLSIPLNGKGGILFMGKVTYWDTLVLAAQGFSRIIEDETLDMVNSVSTSPYIRSAGLSMNYRITPDLDWRLNAFFGSDGVGATYRDVYDDNDVSGTMEVIADYNNYQGFLITGLTACPNPKLALKFTGGAGFIYTATDNSVEEFITASYNDDFLNLFPQTEADRLRSRTFTAPDLNATASLFNTIFNAQLRADADIDLGKGFIAAFGVHELYSLWKQEVDINLAFMEFTIDEIRNQNEQFVWYMEQSGLFPIINIPGARIVRPTGYASEVLNHGFTTSAYSLLEYVSPNKRFGAELGLRLDHLYFIGKDFNFQTDPALNPRINFDFEIMRNQKNIDSLSVTIGTGLFSSINSLLSFFDPNKQNINTDNINAKLNRSWTSIIGLKIDFFEKYSFNIEGYYKRIFDRAYITTPIGDTITPQINFDGIGNIWGFDLQLQRMESRYIDGWISYTFTWAKFHNPSGGGDGLVIGGGDGLVSMGGIDSMDGWYYPSFHRFHNFNLVLNIKPLSWFHIGIRFGFASGQPTSKEVGDIYPYPVQVVDENFMPQLDENGEPVIVQKYRRDSKYDINYRTPWEFPLDIKFSFFPANRKGRASMEIYLAAENLISLFYKKPEPISFNEYTGVIETGGGFDIFDMAIPMISFGFKWRY